MSMMEAVGSVFKNYANFKGRARRSEYWKFSFFSILVYILGFILIAVTMETGRNFQGGFATFVALLLGLFILVSIIPNLSVTCRRLHDVGKSGAYIFIVLVPVVGEILLWIWSIQDGEPWTNRYGVDPKGRNYANPNPVPSPTPTPEPIPTPEPTPEPDPKRAHSRSDGTYHVAYSKKCRYCNSIMPSDADVCPNCNMNNSSDTFIPPDPDSPSKDLKRKKNKGFYIPTELD